MITVSTKKQAIACLLLAGACSAGAEGSELSTGTSKQTTIPVEPTSSDYWFEFDSPAPYFTRADELACSHVGFDQQPDTRLSDFYTACYDNAPGNAQVIWTWGQGTVAWADIPAAGDLDEETRICSEVRGSTGVSHSLHCARPKTEDELAELAKLRQEAQAESTEGGVNGSDSEPYEDSSDLWD